MRARRRRRRCFTGIYGGYFGAAQGIILLALLRLCFDDDLQRAHAGSPNVLVPGALGATASRAVLDVDRLSPSAAPLRARRR